MKKLGTVVTALAVLALPAGAAAKPANAEKRNAAKQCRADREAMGTEAFKAQYGNLGKCVRQTVREERAERRQARREAVEDCRAQGLEGREFGRCVSTQAKQNKAEADAEDAQERNAARDCRAEREAMGEEEFSKTYGTNRNGRNAFGKCVSGKAQQQGGDEGETETEEVEEPEAEQESEGPGRPEGAGKPDGVPA